MNVYYKYAKGEKKLYNGSHTSPFLRFIATQYIYMNRKPLFTVGENILVDNAKIAFIIKIHTSNLQFFLKFTTLSKILTKTTSLKIDAD